MSQELIIYRDAPLVFGAAGVRALLQNVRVIVLTMLGSVPLDRAFGHDGRMIDSPAPRVTARLVSELTDVIERYEPRIVVDAIHLDEERHGRGVLMDGRLTPRITFHLREGVEL